MENQLATVENELIFEPAHLTKETIKKYLCPLASDQEITMGLQIAKTFNLNPLKRELYFVKYKADAPMQVLVGYEVYLKRAERSDMWNGMEVRSEGKVEDGSLKAVVKIYRKDWEHPLTHEAFYTEYVQRKFDGTINTFWKNKPITMIKKVAVSQAFRFAFPDEFDGMPYTSDEVIDQEKVIETKIEEPLKLPTAKSDASTVQDTPKPLQDAPGTLKTDKTEIPIAESEPSLEKATELFGGKEVTDITEYINETTQNGIKKIAKQKGFTGSTFKEWLKKYFDLESLSKIPVGALHLVNKKLLAMEDSK